MTKLTISIDISDEETGKFLEGLLNLARNVENKRAREGGLLPAPPEAKKKKPKKPPKPPKYEAEPSMPPEFAEQPELCIGEGPEGQGGHVPEPNVPADNKTTEPLLRAISDAWCARFEAATGSAYAFQGGKDGKAVKALLRDSGGDVTELGTRMDRLFADDFHRKNATLTYFSSAWNKLASSPPTAMSSVAEFAEGEA